jgi:hypothetical protein
MAELAKMQLTVQHEPEYDVEIVRGDDGLAERFLMKPIRIGGVH